MSIISDALIKAEKEKKKPGSPLSLPLKNTHHHKTPKGKKINLWILLLFLLGIALLSQAKYKNIKIEKWAKKIMPQSRNHIKIVSKVPPTEVTTPLAEAPKQEERISFVLSGILFDKKDALAIINGELVREGESVEEATVMEIGPKQVKLRYGEETITLKLP
ncbi:MAG: general secretion pathway protein GspB [Candidatus Omnitrophica bacterium]|nr:general secretion pathway protein GspB [Candidatus Omnitrophota bacterium]